MLYKGFRLKFKYLYKCLISLLGPSVCRQCCSLGTAKCHQKFIKYATIDWKTNFKKEVYQAAFLAKQAALKNEAQQLKSPVKLKSAVFSTPSKAGPKKPPRTHKDSSLQIER